MAPGAEGIEVKLPGLNRDLPSRNGDDATVPPSHTPDDRQVSGVRGCGMDPRLVGLEGFHGIHPVAEPWGSDDPWTVLLMLGRRQQPPPLAHAPPRPSDCASSRPSLAI